MRVTRIRSPYAWVAIDRRVAPPEFCRLLKVSFGSAVRQMVVSACLQLSRQEGMTMSFIDVAIPAVIGLVALVWPNVLFSGSSATPDAKKIRLIRGLGAVLLAAAAIYLVVKIAA